MHTISREQIQSFIQPLGLSVDAIGDMDLLQQALTHKSYAADFSDGIPHNERLEFV
jgi:dsRNA-specific ribonuclease